MVNNMEAQDVEALVWDGKIQTKKVRATRGVAIYLDSNTVEWDFHYIQTIGD